MAFLPTSILGFTLLLSSLNGKNKKKREIKKERNKKKKIQKRKERETRKQKIKKKNTKKESRHIGRLTRIRAAWDKQDQ